MLSESKKSISGLLEDEMNLLLLRSLVSGEAVSVNIRTLSKMLRRHRNTVRKEIAKLFEANVVNVPVCPFIGLYREYPLLVIVQADLPDEGAVREWVAGDKHIFAAYRSRYAEYNTLLLIYHRDVLEYQLWREALTDERKIPPRETRFPSNSLYVSNQLMSKYEPSASICLMEDEVRKRGSIEVNGLELNSFRFRILKHLTSGGVFRLNESLLGRKLGISRKTVAKRIGELQRAGWVLKPVCRFPDLLCPPNYILVYSLIEIKKDREEIILALRNDPHISMLLRISMGGYNALLFSAHPDISEHMDWELSFNKRFPESIGHVNITYLSPRTKMMIDQQKVSLGLIDDRLAKLGEEE